MRRIINFLNQLKNKSELEFLNKLISEIRDIEVYFVGGVVRDLILADLQETEFKIKDIDIVIRNIEAGELQRFLNKFGKVNLVGKTFGVFKFVPNDIRIEEPIDIALPRCEESFKTGGHRDFIIQSEPSLPIEIDLSRRDFTINAIAIDYKNGDIIDPYDGISDIEKRRIKAVGNPFERFSEDLSRILRAIRFACQLNFRIEKNTWAAIKSLMRRINEERIINGVKERIVAKELIARELSLSLLSNPAKMINLYDESGALKELMPELLELKGVPQPKEFHSEGDVWEHTIICLKMLMSKKFKKKFPDWDIDPGLIFAVMYHDIGKPSTISFPEEGSDGRITFYEHAVVGAQIAFDAIQRLSLSNAGIRPEEVQWLIKNHMLFINADYKQMRNATIIKYFFDKQTGEISSIGKKLLMLNYCDALATIPASSKPNLKNLNGILERINQIRDKTKAEISLPKIFLNGNEIMEILNIKPGPLVGKLIELLREEQLSGRIKSREEAIAFIKKESEKMLTS